MLVLTLLVSAQARAQDEVHWRTGDRHEAHTVGAIVAETLAGIQVRTGGEAATSIPAGAVLDVAYEIPADMRLALRSALNEERAAAMSPTVSERGARRAAAQQKYRALASAVSRPEARRYFEFKAAGLMAAQVELEPAKALAAEETLARFIKQHANAWEVIPAVRMLARVRTLAGDRAGACAAYDELRRTPGLPPTVAWDAASRVVELLLCGRLYDDAERRLNDLGHSPGETREQATRRRALGAICRTGKGSAADARELEGLLGEVPKPALKALALNTLGDFYRRSGRIGEARWAYLAVDVLYRQDPDQHARALDGLSVVCKALNQDALAAEFRKALQTDDRFAATEYRRQSRSPK